MRDDWNGTTRRANEAKGEREGESRSMIMSCKERYKNLPLRKKEKKWLLSQAHKAAAETAGPLSFRHLEAVSSFHLSFEEKNRKSLQVGRRDVKKRVFACSLPHSAAAALFFLSRAARALLPL